MKEKPTNPAWERLQYIVAESGRKDLASFARSLGLKSASGLYAIRKTGVIGKLQAARIHRTYPRFPIEWLMGAEGGPSDFRAGNSYLSVNGNPIVSLPVYSNLCPYGTKHPPLPEHVVYLSQNLCNGGTLAALYHGDALSPKIQRGALLLLRPCSPEDIICNRLYFVLTAYSCGYRIVKPGRRQGRVLLTSCRTDIYPDKEVSREQIEKLFLICAVFSLTYPSD